DGVRLAVGALDVAEVDAAVPLDPGQDGQEGQVKCAQLRRGGGHGADLRGGAALAGRPGARLQGTARQIPPAGCGPPPIRGASPHPAAFSGPLYAPPTRRPAGTTCARALTAGRHSSPPACLALLPEKSPNLAHVVEAWPGLPDAIRRAVLA